MSAFSAVYWKDMQEMVFGRGRQSLGVLFSSLVFVGLAVVQSFAIGQYFPSAMLTLSFAALTIVVTVVSFAADAVAGERERHTLETLLAMPVPAASLYWGKMAAMLTVGVAGAFWTGIIGLLVVTGLFGAWAEIGIPLVLLFVFLGAGLLLGALLGAIGMIVSARCRTVQQAGMIMAFTMFPVMIIVMGLPALGLFGSLFLMRADFGDPQRVLDALVLGVGFAALIAAGLAAGLVAIGLKLFARHRLMLS